MKRKSVLRHSMKKNRFKEATLKINLKKQQHEEKSILINNIRKY